MRTQFILLMLLMVAGLAGCISDDAEPNSGTQAAPGTYGTHAAYGYRTPGMLPMTEDGVTRVANADGTVDWFRPLGESWSGRTPTGMESVAGVSSTQGHGITVVGPLVIYGGDGQTNPPLVVVDVTDPTNPIEVGRNDEVPVRDAEPIIYPDGRIVIITTGGGQIQYATDVTDPANPVMVSQTETAHGNHNIAVVPGTPIAYNTGSNGFIDILDYTDPSEPIVAGTYWNGHGCHDITFYMSQEEDKYRAYCAASSGDRVQIWDLEDPLKPGMIYDGAFESIGSSLPDAANSQLPTGGAISPASISHLAMVNHDASILIVGDETGGGSAPACDYYYEADGETLSGPHGNLWFYDLSNETNPILLSHLSPDAYDGAVNDAPPGADTVAGSCTSHFGRLVEDTDFLVMSFYTSGVLLIDFTDPAVPIIVDELAAGGSVWDVWVQDGWLYTGDMTRGMDVLKLV